MRSLRNAIGCRIGILWKSGDASIPESIEVGQGHVLGVEIIRNGGHLTRLLLGGKFHFHPVSGPINEANIKANLSNENSID